MALLDFSGSPHGGVLKLLPEWQSQPRITPIGIVDHTIVGSGSGAWYYFRDLTGTESHFIMLMSGVIWQLMDTARTADAQVSGNYFLIDGKPHGLISIEHEDDGTPIDTPFTQAQVESNIWLSDKLARVHGLARRKCTSPTGPGAAGKGYHSMWGMNTSTNKTINPWTTAAGKGCPDPPRIRQWDGILLPRYMNGTPTSTPEDDMFEAADRTHLVHVDDVLSKNNVAGKVNDLTDDMAALKATLTEVLDAVKALTPTPPPAG